MANRARSTKSLGLDAPLDPPSVAKVKRRRLLLSASSVAVAGLACLGLGQVALAQVAEQITYQYDALGRLTNVAHSGSVNNGVSAAYTLDAAGNRTNVTVTAAALPTLSISGGSATEGSPITFTVTRSSNSGTSSVNYATADGTAHAGSDYTAASNTLNFAAGQTSQSFTVSTTDNAVVDGQRNFSVNLSSASGATIATGQATGTINDNDTAPSFSISGGSATEGGTITFTVTRSGSTSGSYSVNYATANNSATAGSDYNAASGTLTFAAGQTTQSFTVSTIDDTLVEGTETFFANLSGATGGATITTSQATGTINDNDSPPSFSISNASATEGGTLAFTVTRSGAATGTYTVNYATANNSAVAGSDYNAASGTLTFTAAGSQTVNISTIDDSVVESTETMYVNLSGASGGATISTSQGVGTITDNDVAGPLVVTVPSGGPVNLRTLANSNGYTNQTSVTFNLPSGSTVTGGAGGGVAIDTGSWSGTALTLNVAGTVRGGGGNGGNGGTWPSTGSAGGNGGDAITCHAPITISVSGAVQAGGGGGGGGGSATFNAGPAGTGNTGGNGGGGGAPNGNGGSGGSSSLTSAGIAGSPGTTAGGGSPGNGSSNPAGGAGGTYANAGGAGTPPVSSGSYSMGGVGGAAGYAVRTNGTGCTASGNITGTVG
jgi:hypothetical protein